MGEVRRLWWRVRSPSAWDRVASASFIVAFVVLVPVFVIAVVLQRHIPWEVVAVLIAVAVAVVIGVGVLATVRPWPANDVPPLCAACGERTRGHRTCPACGHVHG